LCTDSERVAQHGTLVTLEAQSARVRGDAVVESRHVVVCRASDDDGAFFTLRRRNVA